MRQIFILAFILVTLVVKVQAQDNPPTLESPPLFIVNSDGKTFQIPKTGNPTAETGSMKIISLINPDWIESINVLKQPGPGNQYFDAYGEAGRNGVVLIKLKSGYSDKLPEEVKKYEKRN